MGALDEPATKVRVQFSRSATATGGLGALAVVLLMAFSPIASAGVGTNVLFAGASPDSSAYAIIHGCAALSHSVNKLSPRSGIGKFDVATKVASCPRSAGMNTSETWVLSILGDVIPVKLKASSKGVSIALSVNALLSDFAVIRGSTARCPISYQNSTSWNGTTWFNQTYAAADCHVLGNVYVSTYAYLEDTSTGVFMYPNSAGTTYWSNESGYSASYVAFSWDYSNPAYWAYNYTSPGSWTNYSYGSGGSQHISATPVYYFNGTFLGSDKYVLGAYFENEVFSEQAHFKGAAKAEFNAATVGNHEDFTAVTTY